MRRDLRRDAGARHVHHRRPPRGDRLLPAHDRRRGADVCGREDPRRLLPTRGAPERDRDPDRPADRSSDAPELQGGLPRRGAGRDHRPVGRHGEPVRHPRHERGEPGHDALGHPVRGSRRLGASRVHPERVGHQPDVPGRRRGDVRHRRRRSPERRRAGGHPDDRGRGAGQHLDAVGVRRRLGADRGRRRAGPGGRQARDRRADRVPAGVRGEGRREAEAVRAQAALRHGHLRGRQIVREGAARGRDRARQAGTRRGAAPDQGRVEGASARRLGCGDVRGPLRPRSRRRGRTCRSRSCAHACSRRAFGWTAGGRGTSGRCRPRSA